MFFRVLCRQPTARNKNFLPLWRRQISSARKKNIQKSILRSTRNHGISASACSHTKKKIFSLNFMLLRNPLIATFPLFFSKEKNKKAFFFRLHLITITHWTHTPNLERKKEKMKFQGSENSKKQKNFQWKGIKKWSGGGFYGRRHVEDINFPVGKWKVKRKKEINKCIQSSSLANPPLPPKPFWKVTWSKHDRLSFPMPDGWKCMILLPIYLYFLASCFVLNHMANH